MQKMDNCCGNEKCEEEENQCSCPEDCKEDCEGDVEFITSTGYKHKSEYFQYQCVKEECQIRYDTSRIDPRQAYHELRGNDIVVGLMLDYIQPFEINYGKMKLELTLKDVTSDLVLLPIYINDIRVMETSLILGRRSNVNKMFEKVGDVIEVEFPLSYSMKLPEEQKMVTLSIDYKYMRLKKLPIRDSEGRYIADEYGQILYVYLNDTFRISSFQQVLTEKIYFIDPNYDKIKIDFSQG